MVFLLEEGASLKKAGWKKVCRVKEIYGVKSTDPWP